MANELIPLGMQSNVPSLRPDKPSDMPMGEDPGLDEEDIANCVMEDFINDVKDKEEFGWLEKQEYAYRAYYGIKDVAMMNRPWPGASAFPVPITPTILDTIWANIIASMKAEDGTWCRVTGVGEEDIRKAVPLNSLMNWQLSNQIPMDRVQDLNAFRTPLQGNGLVKVMQDLTNNAVKVISFDVENFYIPIDAEGVQFGENNGHCTQIIPLSQNDIEMRKLWGVYKNLDKMVPGARISRGKAGNERLQQIKDVVAGQSKERRNRRETFFMAETYMEYFPKSGSAYGGPTRAAVKPKYIIVWWSPNGGTIHRIAQMDDKTVPFANHDLYPNPGYFFSMSLPEKIKNIQEKANYADKQNTDALDKQNAPAMFVSDTTELEKARAKRVLGGIYNLGGGGDNKVFYEPLPPRERGFETEVQRMWVEAQQLSGTIDISYGGQAKRDERLGQTRERIGAAGIRFSAIFRRMERGFKDTLKLIHKANNKYMDRKIKVKVIGYADYKSVDEIFPNQESGEMGLGIEGQYDFAFAGAAINERERENENKKLFYGAMSAAPDVMANPHDAWNVKEQLAEAYGIRDLETVITKPAQALIVSAQEYIQRVVSGQTDIPLRPGLDTDSYIFEIELFMRSETFMALYPPLQMELMKGLKLTYLMRAAEMLGMMDLQLVQQKQMAGQQAAQMDQMVQKRASMPKKESVAA